MKIEAISKKLKDPNAPPELNTATAQKLEEALKRQKGSLEQMARSRGVLSNQEPFEFELSK